MEDNWEGSYWDVNNDFPLKYNVKSGLSTETEN